MLDRLLDQPLCGIPRACSLVERSDILFADVRLQVLLQQPLEQVVKAIPPLARVEGDNEHIHALQPVQGCPYVIVKGISANDRCTQLGAELL